MKYILEKVNVFYFIYQLLHRYLRNSLYIWRRKPGAKAARQRKRRENAESTAARKHSLLGVNTAAAAESAVLAARHPAAGAGGYA